MRFFFFDFFSFCCFSKSSCCLALTAAFTCDISIVKIALYLRLLLLSRNDNCNDLIRSLARLYSILMSFSGVLK